MSDATFLTYTQFVSKGVKNRTSGKVPSKHRSVLSADGERIGHVVVGPHRTETFSKFVSYANRDRDVEMMYCLASGSYNDRGEVTFSLYDLTSRPLQREWEPNDVAQSFTPVLTRHWWKPGSNWRELIRHRFRRIHFATIDGTLVAGQLVRQGKKPDSSAVTLATFRVSGSHEVTIDINVDLDPSLRRWAVAEALLLQTELVSHNENF